MPLNEFQIGRGELHIALAFFRRDRERRAVHREDEFGRQPPDITDLLQGAQNFRPIVLPLPGRASIVVGDVKIEQAAAGRADRADRVGLFDIEVKSVVNDAQIVTGSVPAASVTYMAEANGFKVRFGGALAPTQYAVESGILKVSSGGTFVRDLSGPHAFMSTAAPW